MPDLWGEPQKLEASNLETNGLAMLPKSNALLNLAEIHLTISTPKPGRRLYFD